MSNFNENTRVQVPAALHLCKLGYTYLDKIEALDTGTNIIVDVFLESVKNLNPGISGTEVSILFSKIVSIANNDDLGREFYQLLSTNSGIKLIDFDNLENNVWHVTTELPSSKTTLTDYQCVSTGCCTHVAKTEITIDNQHVTNITTKVYIFARLTKRKHRKNHKLVTFS